MAYKYYLTAVDVLDSPFAMPRICAGLHCPYPTANVSASTDPFKCAMKNCPQPRADVHLMLILLRLINATADVIPTPKTFDEAVSMVHNGTADITLKHVFQEKKHRGKVDFTSTVRTFYTGYVVKETTEIEVVNYILKSFTFEVGQHK
ncbi:unnamed protein product [Cylicostephanus goldi]|uniref:Uncharacterized protein n=1 Tax=Cylicostephanus goldi TaxID=71465 RepID=A0A3P6QPF0_CYLGO|nr:unnamed protein product [Cylicostephanus goldi]